MKPQALKRREVIRQGLATIAFLPWLGMSPWPEGKHLKEKLPYKGDLPLYLNQNESPYGLPPKARRAAIEALNRAHLYPHDHYSELKESIAAREGLKAEQVILGAGSTEVMTMAINSYGKRGEVLMAEPTYFDFEDFASAAGCMMKKIPLDKDYRHDLEQISSVVTSRTNLIYICNPHNPTATVVGGQELKSFCQKVTAKFNPIILIDEAYYDYVDDPAYESMISLVKKGYPILVTRTFSKIYGMAGMRVGYGLASPEIIKTLEKVRTNFASIAYPSLKAALMALKERDFLLQVKEANTRIRKFLTKSLLEQGYFVLPSQANFILFEIKADAEEWAQRLEEFEVYVRPFKFFNKNWLRVSLGRKDEMEVFLSRLNQLKSSWPLSHLAHLKTRSW